MSGIFPKDAVKFPDQREAHDQQLRGLRRHMATTQSKLPIWLQRLSIPMMLLSGTVTTVVQKFMLEQKTTGRPNRAPHKFKKPWYLVLVMFVGELAAMIIYKLQRRCKPSVQHLDGLLDSDAPPPRQSTGRIFLILAIPSLCDLVGTAIMSVGLLYIQASFWQMLRGALTIFSAILDWAALRRPQRAHMWAGVVLVTISLCMVGLAAVCSNGIAIEGVWSG
jgi:drug/metabolite transporter (DMT)-like permease